MKPIYVQHLLKVLLEEYQDIDFMIDTMVAEQPSRGDRESIRNLLDQLSQQNHKLLEKFSNETAAPQQPVSVLRTRHG